MNSYISRRTVWNLTNIRGFHAFNYLFNSADLLQRIRADFYKGDHRTPSLKSLPRTNQPFKIHQKEHFQRDRPPKAKKKLVIKWSTGTDRAQAAANAIVKEILEANRRGEIKVIDHDTNNIQSLSIRDFVKGLNLDTHGLSIVDVEKANSGLQIPLIKVIDVKTALKKYTDHIAKVKEQELSTLGVLKKKNSSMKRDNSSKHIKISWEISDDDLKNQKTNEIVSLLQKGHKVNLYIDSKSTNLSKIAIDNFLEVNDEEHHYKLSKREFKNRTSLVENIKGIVELHSIKPVIEGSINHKMMIKLTPKQIPKETVDRNALKNERKRERQLKLQKRIEKKKSKEHIQV